MNVAITGSSGRLGRAVVAELTDSHDVIRVDQVDDGSGLTRIANLADPAAASAALSGCSAVVHTAGIPRPQGHSSADVFATNSLITFNVAQAAEAGGITDLVYVSSVSVLGYPFSPRPLRPEYLPLDERQVPAPQEAYGLSKYVGEVILAAAAIRSTTGMRMTVLRMPWIQTAATFGEDVTRALQDEFASRNLWAYLDHRDAARAVRLSLSSEIGVENGGVRTMYVSAADNFADRPTAALVAEVWPGLSCPVERDGSLLSNEMASEVLGFEARHSWREYPGPA